MAAGAGPLQASADPREKAIAPRPPAEVVLAAPYYALLALEALALVVLSLNYTFTPQDPLGFAIGWTGTASMCVMHVYSIRRRVRAFSRWGRLRDWLQLHIFLGLQGALLVTFHSLHLRSLSNISGITLGLTLTVVLSGIFGRYLYSLLPRGIAGERLDARAVDEELAELATTLASDAGLAAMPHVASALAAVHSLLESIPRSPGPAPTTSTASASITRPAPASLTSLVADDLRARAALRQLSRALAAARKQSIESVDAASFDRYAQTVRRRAALSLRIATLQRAERLFRGWTVLHKPLTFVLFGSVFLHVLAHYVFAGYSA